MKQTKDINLSQTKEKDIYEIWIGKNTKCSCTKWLDILKSQEYIIGARTSIVTTPCHK